MSLVDLGPIPIVDSRTDRQLVTWERSEALLGIGARFARDCVQRVRHFEYCQFLA